MRAHAPTRVAHTRVAPSVRVLMLHVLLLRVLVISFLMIRVFITCVLTRCVDHVCTVMGTYRFSRCCVMALSTHAMPAVYHTRQYTPTPRVRVHALPRMSKTEHRIRVATTTGYQFCSLLCVRGVETWYTMAKCQRQWHGEQEGGGWGG